MEEVREYIAKNWHKTFRAPSFLRGGYAIPKPYVSPSMDGRYTDLYYWDVYFINLGLLLDGYEEQVENNLDNMAYFIDECHKIGARVIVNIPTPVVDAQYLTRHESEPFEPYGGPNGIVSLYAQACREVAREKNCVAADLNEYFLSLSDYTKYFPDGVHPSDTGYKMYGNVVADIYERLWLGDVNDDGKIDEYDCILIMRHYFGTYELDEKQTTRSDADFDGDVDQYDYLLVARHYFGTYKLLGQ